MSSSREKLRAMSKKNLEDQKQAASQPTLVSDMVEQLNSGAVETANETVEPSSETVEPSNETVEPSSETAKPAASKSKTSKSSPKKPKKAKSTAAPDNFMNKPTTDAPKAEPEAPKAVEAAQEAAEPVEAPAETSAAPDAEAPAPQAAEKYTGREVTVTLLLSPEVEEFLTYKAIERRIPAKQFFKELMINEIENGNLVEDALAKAYRKVQHDTVKKSIPVCEDLKEAIKEAAIKHHMKYTPFMAYVIDKARLKDLADTK